MGTEAAHILSGGPKHNLPRQRRLAARLSSHLRTSSRDCIPWLLALPAVPCAKSPGPPPVPALRPSCSSLRPPITGSPPGVLRTYAPAPKGSGFRASQHAVVKAAAPSLSLKRNAKHASLAFLPGAPLLVLQRRIVGHSHTVRLRPSPQPRSIALVAGGGLLHATRALNTCSAGRGSIVAVVVHRPTVSSTQRLLSHAPERLQITRGVDADLAPRTGPRRRDGQSQARLGAPAGLLAGHTHPDLRYCKGGTTTSHCTALDVGGLTRRATASASADAPMLCSTPSMMHPSGSQW